MRIFILYFIRKILKTQLFIMPNLCYNERNASMDAALEKKFEEQLEPLGIRLSEKQKTDFRRYLCCLQNEAKKYNLTGITKEEDIIEKHFIDSLMPAKFVNFSACATFLDAGTGAGFPGVPLKIAFPHLMMTLLETSGKKTAFLKTLLDGLCVDAYILNGRAEALARGQYRESFDMVAARAFGNLSETLECTIPFAKQTGNVILYQGKISGKTQAQPFIEMLGGKIKDVPSFKLPFSHADRALLVIEKIAATPERFPRKASIPRKRPLFNIRGQ